ncbi:DUF3048 domain-containing protein [Bacillus kwashiorkori]|uniref:DUF3048 domain-containing protein n=1 Tax=Bacillus kwashiorkori TaxID=1522318 RepID=UPI000B099795|nr:DUF3048 domain-containing protein [Bacillus kwashiorkori]
MTNKYKFLLSAIVFFVFLIAGCSKKEETENKSASNDDLQLQSEKQQDIEPVMFQFPLTGMETTEQSDNRAISVMINNHPSARPQSGLQKADIVYEVLAEGGITRLLAVFQSEMPEKVGPIRSARDYYIQLAKGFNSFYIFHGWSPSAKKLIEQGIVDSLNGLTYDGTLFKRASFRVAPHNSYITYKNIVKGAGEKQVSLTGAPKANIFLKDKEDIIGEDLNKMTISYSDKNFEVQYEYDQTIGKYIRFSGGVQTLDLESKDPIVLDNIFIVEMKHGFLKDGYRRWVDLQSGGSGYALQKGKLLTIEWKNVDGRIVPYKDGKPLPYVPGKTWVNIVPNLNLLSY